MSTYASKNSILCKFPPGDFIQEGFLSHDDNNNMAVHREGKKPTRRPFYLYLLWTPSHPKPSILGLWQVTGEAKSFDAALHHSAAWINYVKMQLVEHDHVFYVAQRHQISKIWTHQTEAENSTGLMSIIYVPLPKQISSTCCFSLKVQLFENQDMICRVLPRDFWAWWLRWTYSQKFSDAKVTLDFPFPVAVLMRHIFVVAIKGLSSCTVDTFNVFGILPDCLNFSS